MLRSLLMCSLVLAFVGAVTGQEPRKIEVRATGEVTVAADELTLPVEVITGGDEFGAVKQRNDLLLTQLFELLSAHKMPRPAIESTTGSFDFSPDEPYRNYGNQKAQGAKQTFNQPANNANDPFGEPKFPGGEKSARLPIHLSRRVTLKFTSLAQATELLAKLTALDAVKKSRELRLSPLQASAKEVESHQEQARLNAVRKALQKAELLAQASNLKLGPALSITDETTSGHSRAVYFSPASDPFGRLDPRSELDPRATDLAFVIFQPEKAPAELAPGQIQFTVMVRVVYEATLAK
jgi:uncharacterized protein YggE